MIPPCPADGGDEVVVEGPIRCHPDLGRHVFPQLAPTLSISPIRPIHFDGVLEIVQGNPRYRAIVRRVPMSLFVELR